MSEKQNVVIQRNKTVSSINKSLSQLSESQRTKSRINKPVTMTEINTIDKLAITLTGNVQHNLSVMLGKAIIQSDFKIDKQAINFKIQDTETGKVSDKGLAKRSGIIQSAILRLKKNSHHLKNVPFLADLLPCGTNNATTKIFGSAIGRFWNIFHNQMSMRNGQNIYDFVVQVIDYLENNDKIDNETEILLYKIGKRFYSDSEHGVNVRKITFGKWIELFQNMADSRLKMEKNSEIVKDTREKKTEQRKADKQTKKAETELNVKWQKMIVELALNNANLETLQKAILKGNDTFNIVDTKPIKLAV